VFVYHQHLTKKESVSGLIHDDTFNSKVMGINSSPVCAKWHEKKMYTDNEIECHGKYSVIYPIEY